MEEYNHGSLEESKDVDDARIEEKPGHDFDPVSYYENNAGRLVVDPAEARAEFGDDIANGLKLSFDGSKVLWPQPLEDPGDPQNWSDFRKGVQLLIITLAAIVPDFDSGLGTASIFALATQFNTTTGEINNLTNNWSIFLLGWGGIFAVMAIRRYGRLPVLFWTQLIALGFLVGCTFAPNLRTFAAMRCLTAFFGTCPQVTGLYIVTDMYPFHLQARKLNIWTMGFLVSPFLSPFAFGFMVARTSWRWVYGIGSIYGAIVLLLIVLFGEETMYDRRPGTPKLVSTAGSTILRRVEVLIGVTGASMAKYRASWWDVSRIWIQLTWRPHVFGVLLFEAMLFGFSVGINGTNNIFLKTPKPEGYGFSQFAVAGCYGTPVVAVVLGELLGRYMNDFIMNFSIRRNNGVFKSENRLWSCYVAVVLYVVGMVLMGAAFQDHLTIAAFIIGWGLVEIATMVNTVAIYAYLNDSFPKFQGETSALLNLARILGGFSVTYFQVPWASRNGALQTFGCEAAVAAGLFLIIVPALQVNGQYFRVSLLLDSQSYL
ncbi:MFS general substrate transporter [Irpex rosettiformis]|uniref:MFS general substrate transporter n=1 Tax=Irpex rosettiformis TaxID=378272 RepID=A0ACB8U3R2_9APHY|nr:MFS general substrate transporter [Irpex rosettiformis]